MHTLTITVQRRAEGGWPVVAEATAVGHFLPARTESLLRFADVPVAPDDDSHLERVRAHLTGLAPDMHAYGEALGRALFRGALRDAFGKALERSGGALHVLLFVEDPHLQRLRWERVCGPIDGRWVLLALDQRVPLSLYLPAVTDRRFRPIGRRDLRALVVVASPTDIETKYRMPSFDAATAVAGVRAALGGIPCTVLAATPDAAGPPTLDAICERITAEAHSLLHVVCHGRYLRTERQTVLYLAGPGGTTVPVTDAQLIERLGGLAGARGLPHFALLCACESATPEAADGAGSLAHQMVRELGMPAVLAMTEPVTIGTSLALTAQFYVRLREHGQPALALAESWAGLAARPDVHVPALFGRLGGRPLFTDDLASGRELTPSEINNGLIRAVALLRERAPVVESEFGRHEVVVRRALETPAEGLPTADRKDRETALVAIDAVCQRVLEVSFAGLALGHKEPVYDARCPFRGLYSFRATDQEFFFGRETLIEHLHGKLAEHNFLAVLGPSGSGKSSVVMAGLLPRLAHGRSKFELLYLTPGGEPDTFLDTLFGATPSPDLLLVDQFEELFTLCTDPARRRAFVEQLLGAVPRMLVVITMRADFWGECAALPALKELMQARQELVGSMTTAELRTATDRQAQHVGLRFEADLSQTLVDEVAGEPGAMPLLQHALQEVWKRRHGRWLMASEYRAVGGVRKAIAETAEGVYRDLSDADRERMRDIFVRLTRLGDDAADGARRDTRQRVTLSELIPVTGAGDETKRLVKRLADEGARLLVSGTERGEEMVEVAHEALIRHWPRLRGWLDEDRIDLRLLSGVRIAAAEWEKNRTDESLLAHRGARLTEAERLKAHPRIDLNRLEADYLAACAALQERERLEKEERARQELEQAKALAESQRRRIRVFRAAAGISSGLLVLAVASGLLAYVSYRQAHAALKKESQALAAKNEAFEKETQALSAKAQALESEKAAHESARAINNAQGELFDLIDEEQSQKPEFQRFAIAAFQKVNKSFEAELAAKPTNDVLKRDLSEKFISLAWNFQNMGQMKDAVTTYQRASGLLTELGRAQPDDLKLQLRRSFVLNNIAWVYADERNRPQALEFSNQALALRERLLAAHPDHPECMRQVAVSYANLGTLYSEMEEHARALEYLSKGQGIQERMIVLQPDVLWHQLNLSSTLNSISDIHQTRRDFPTAKEVKRRAYQIRKETLDRRKARPESPKEIALTVYQHKFAAICVEYAALLLDAGDEPGRAGALAGEGLPVIADLSTRSPDNDQYRMVWVFGLRTSATALSRGGEDGKAREQLALAVNLIDKSKGRQLYSVRIEAASCRLDMARCLGRLKMPRDATAAALEALERFAPLWQERADAQNRSGVIDSLKVMEAGGAAGKEFVPKLAALRAKWSEAEVAKAADRALAAMQPSPKRKP